MVELLDAHQLLAFLGDKPIEWSRQIAVRSALRVLPVALTTGLPETAWFPTLRACFLSWADSRSNSRYSRSTNLYAARAAGEAANSISEPESYSIRAAAVSAEFAANFDRMNQTAAAMFVTNIAIFSFDCVAHRRVEFGNADSDIGIWSALNADVHWLSMDGNQNPQSLFMQRLWIDSMPKWAVHDWNKFSNNLRAIDKGYRHWIHWYNSLLNGNPKITEFFGVDLTSRIVQQSEIWWARPSQQVNADIAAWLEERNKAQDNSKDNYLDKGIDRLPELGPAPVDFTRTPAGRLHADPVRSDKPDKAAQTYLNGLRDKLGKIIPELSGRNSDPFVIETLQNLQKSLPATLAEADPFHIDLTRLTIESIGESYNNAAGEAELFPGAVARIVDVARTALRFCQCFPEFRETESDGKGMGITAAQAAEMSPVAESAVKGLENADVLDDSAKSAFAETVEELKNARTETAKRDLLARLLQMLRNAMLTLLKAAKPPASAMADELKSLGRDSYKEARPGLVKIGRTVILGTVLTAVGYTVTPLTRLADQLPQFKEIADFAKSLKELAKPSSTPSE
jgi:hypothetical protein